MNMIFAYIGDTILFINCMLCLKSFSKNGKAFKILACYCCLMLIIQLAAEILSGLQIHNLFLSHFYFIIQFVMLSFFYHNLLREKFQKRIIRISLLLCLSVLAVQYAMDWHSFFEFNTFEIFITSLPLIVFATFHLYNQLDEKKQYYYINIGILIYLFGSTAIFLTANLLTSMHTKRSFVIIFDLNIYLYVVYQLFIAYDLIKKPETKSIAHE